MEHVSPWLKITTRLWEIRMAMVRQSTLSGTWEIPGEGRSADDHVRDQYKGGTYRDLNFQSMGMGQGEGREPEMLQL